MESSRSAVGSADEVSSRSGGVTSPAKMARRSARRSGRRGDRPPGRRPLRKPATPEPNPEFTVEDKVMHWWMEERSAYHPEWQRPEAWKWPEGRGGAPRAAAGAAAAGLGSRVSSSRKSTMRTPAVPPSRKANAAAAGAACRPAAKGQAKGAPTLVAPAAARPCGPFICYGLHNCYLLDAEHTAARDGNYAARMAAQRKKAHAGPKPFIAGGTLGGIGSALPGGACAAGGASGGLLACAGGGARRRLSQPAPRVRDGPAFAFELDADEEGVHALYRARVHSSPRAIAQINRRLRAQLVARAVPLGGTWSSSSALRVGELCRLRKIGEGIEEAAAGAAGSAHKAAACPVSKPIFSAVESSLLKEVQASLTVSKKSVAGTAKAFPAKAGAHVKNVTFKPPKSRSTSPHSPTPTSTSPKIQSARSPSPRPPKSPPFKFTAGQPSRPKSPPSRSLQSSSPPPRTQAPKRQPQKFPAPTSSSVTSPPSRSSPSRSPSRSSPSRSSPTRSSPTRSTPSPTAPSSPTPTSTLCGAPPDRTPPSRQSRTVFPKSPLSRSPTLSTTSSTTTSAVCVVTTDQSPNRHRTSVSPSSQGKAVAKRAGSPIQWSAANKRASSRRGPAAGGAPPGMSTPNVARCLSKTSSLRTSSSSLLPAEPSPLRRAAASGPYPYPYPLRPDAPARRPRVRSCLDAQTAALREARARLAGKLPKNRSAMTLPPKTAQAEAEGDAALEGEGEGDGEKGAPGEKQAWPSRARMGTGPASVEGAGAVSGAPKAAARAVRRRSESQLVHAARSETDKWLASRAGCRRQAAGLKVVDLLMPPEASATASDDPASKGFPEASAASRVGAGAEMRAAWSRSSFGALGPQPTGGRRQRGGPGVDALLPRPATERAVPHTEKSLRRHTVRAGRLAAPHPAATRSALFCFADAEPPREPLTPFLTDDSSPFGWQGGDDVAGKRSSEVQVDGVPDPYAYPDSPFEDEPYAGSRRVVGSILKRKSNDPISSSLKMYEEFSKLMEDTGHPSSCTSLIRASSAVGSQTLDDDSPRARDVQTSPPTSEGPRWKAVTSPRSLATLRDLSSGDVSWPTDSTPCTSKNAPSFAECEPKFCDQPSSADATKSSRKQNIAFDRILDMVMHEVEGSSNAKVRAKFRGIRQRKNGTPHWSTLLDETKAAEFSNLLTSRNEEYTVPPPQTLTRDDAASPPKTSPTPVLSPTRAEGAALGSAPGSRTPGSRRPRTKSADVLRGPVDDAGMALAQAPAEEAAGQRPAGVGGVASRGPARRGPVADARAGAPPMGPAACLGMALPLRGAASGPQVMQLSRPKEEHLPRRAAAGVMRGAPLGTSDDLRAPADARWKLCRPQMTPQQISRAPAKGPLRVDSRLRGRFPEGPPPPLAPPGARPPARRPPAAVEAPEGVDELLAPAIPRARAITSSSLGKLASTLRRAERFC